MAAIRGSGASGAVPVPGGRDRDKDERGISVSPENPIFPLLRGVTGGEIQESGLQGPMTLPGGRDFVPTPQGAGGTGGGGGGGGGGGFVPSRPGTEQEAQVPLVTDLLSRLRFPQQTQFHTFMRPFAQYVEKLLVNNPGVAIPVPKLEEGRLVLGEGSQVETFEVPEEVEAYSEMWQTFLDTVSQTSDMMLMQQLQRLRFPGAETGFILGGAGQFLPNPREL